MKKLIIIVFFVLGLIMIACGVYLRSVYTHLIEKEHFRNYNYIMAAGLCFLAGIYFVIDTLFTLKSIHKPTN